jgi:hypothetical protein
MQQLGPIRINCTNSELFLSRGDSRTAVFYAYSFTDGRLRFSRKGASYA